MQRHWLTYASDWIKTGRWCFGPLSCHPRICREKSSKKPWISWTPKSGSRKHQSPFRRSMSSRALATAASSKAPRMIMPSVRSMPDGMPRRTMSKRDCVPWGITGGAAIAARRIWLGSAGQHYRRPIQLVQITDRQRPFAVGHDGMWRYRNAECIWRVWRKTSDRGVSPCSLIATAPTSASRTPAPSAPRRSSAASPPYTSCRTARPPSRKCDDRRTASASSRRTSETTSAPGSAH